MAWRRQSGSGGGRHILSSARAFTLIELLVVISIVALLISIVLPALGTAQQSARMTKCQANAGGITRSSLLYTHDRGKFMPDYRAPGREDAPGGTKPKTYPARGGMDGFPLGDFNQTKLSWFWRLSRWMGREQSQVDCPLTDDLFKYPRRAPFHWWNDYYINPFAINNSPDVASEPARALLHSHPNMARSGYIGTLACVMAFAGRRDSEDLLTGSMPVGFVDGHSTRLITPNTSATISARVPVTFREVLMRDVLGYENDFVLYPKQPHACSPNDLTRAQLPTPQSIPD